MPTILPPAAASAGDSSTITFASSLNGDSISGVGFISPTGTGTITVVGGGQITLTGGEPFFPQIQGGAPLTLDGLNFVSNPSEIGGAIYNDYCVMTLNDCTFTGNSATSGGGGAIDNDSSGTLIINDCTFYNNLAAGDGGAILNSGSLTVIGCTFDGNSSDGGEGGAIANFGSLSVVNSTFYSNGYTSSNPATNKEASQGGAIYNNGTSLLTDVTIDGNAA